MKKYPLIQFIIVILIGFMSAVEIQAAEVVMDSTREGNPIYKSVDVTIDYSWDMHERYESVDVVVIYKDAVAVAVVVEFRDHSKFEYALIEDVLVRIFNHKTGKLILALGKNTTT